MDISVPTGPGYSALLPTVSCYQNAYRVCHPTDKMSSRCLVSRQYYNNPYSKVPSNRANTPEVSTATTGGKIIHYKQILFPTPSTWVFDGGCTKINLAHAIRYARSGCSFYDYQGFKGPWENYLPIISPVLVNPRKGGVCFRLGPDIAVYLPDHQCFWVAYPWSI